MENLIWLAVMYTGTFGMYKAGQLAFNKSLKTSIMSYDYTQLSTRDKEGKCLLQHPVGFETFILLLYFHDCIISTP